MKFKGLTTPSLAKYPENPAAWLKRYRDFFGESQEDLGNFDITFVRNNTSSYLSSETQILKVLCFLFNKYPNQSQMEAYIQSWRIAGPSGVLGRALSEESFALAWKDQHPKDWFFFPANSTVIDLTYTLTYPYVTGIQRVVKEVARFAYQQKTGFYFVGKGPGSIHYPKLVGPTEIAKFMSGSGERTRASVLGHMKALLSFLISSLGSSIKASMKAFLLTLYHDTRSFANLLKKQDVPAGDWVLRLIDESKLVLKEILSKAKKESQIQNNDLNLAFWNTSVLLPEIVLDEKYVDFYKMLRRNGAIRLSMIVYDLGPFSFPEYSAVGQNFTHYLTLLRVADSVSCISESVALDVKNFMPLVSREVPETMVISADLLAGDFTKFLRTSEEASARIAVLEGTIFALVVGTFEPRKNHINILRAFKLFLRNHKDSELHLVFAGNPGWKNDQFIKEVTEEIKNEPRIIKLTSLSDSELSWLYNRCKFLIFCSHLEGFGLPILEALFCRKPVITSARGSMEELAKTFGGCLLVDPNSPVEIASQIEKLNHDEQLRSKLVKTIDLSKAPSWEQYAQNILNRVDASVPTTSSNSAT